MYLFKAAVVATALSEGVLAVSPERPLGRVIRRQHSHGGDAPNEQPALGKWSETMGKGPGGLMPKQQQPGGSFGKSMESFFPKEMQDLMAKAQEIWQAKGVAKGFGGKGGNYSKGNFPKGPKGGKGPWFPQMNHTHTANFTTPKQFLDNKNRLPSWHFINGTTPDAAPDGSVGIYIEPDLVPGSIGKDGARVKKIRLGPHVVPSGRMLARPVPAFQPPCKNCFITAMQLNLEYEDGSIANVDTGAWCHHIDLTVRGTDLTCPTNLESVLSGNSPSMGGKRIFSNGNERVPIRWNTKSKYGLKLGNSTWFGGVMEFMNENVNPIKVYLTMTFEYVDGTTKGYRPAEMFWLDVTDCNFSSDFRALEGKYEKRSREFAVPFNAEILVAVAHQHDGGTGMQMFKNGKLVCSSKTLYGNRRGGFIEPANGQVIPHMVMPPYSHISDAGHCKDFESVVAGDKLSIAAYYDENMHQQMRHAGGRGLDDQMGIMYTYIGLKDEKPVE